MLADPGSAGAVARTALAPLIEAQRPHFDFQGQALGCRYPQPLEAPSTVVPDVVDYVPSAEVGARGPHAWLDGSSGLVSTCDLTRRGFALLTLAEAAAPWLAAIGSMRSATPVPVEVFPVGAAGSPAGCLSDVHGSVRELYGLRGRSAILLRPDGHVQAHLNGIDLHQELARGLADISVPR